MKWLIGMKTISTHIQSLNLKRWTLTVITKNKLHKNLFGKKNFKKCVKRLPLKIAFEKEVIFHSNNKILQAWSCLLCIWKHTDLCSFFDDQLSPNIHRFVNWCNTGLGQLPKVSSAFKFKWNLNKQMSSWEELKCTTKYFHVLPFI